METKEILEQISAGDKAAIKSVYEENVKDVYRFAKSIIGEDDKAMEATRKTFIKFFDFAQKGGQTENIRLEIMKIAYSEACAVAMPNTSMQEESPSEAEPVKEAEPEAAVEESSEVHVETEDAEEEIFNETLETEDSYERIHEETTETEAGVEKVYEDVTVTAAGAAAGSVSETRSLYDTRVIDISEAPEESDRIIEEADETDEDYAYDEYDDEYDDDYEDEDYDETPRSRGLTVALVIVNVILAVLLVWLLAGLLRNFNIIPQSVDIGYSWFNSHIFTLF